MNGTADNALPALGGGINLGGDKIAIDQGGGWSSGAQPVDDRVVNYVFPVEVVVVGALTDDDRRGIYQQVWTDLGDAMTYQNA
jgi:hypothetical protein